MAESNLTAGISLMLGRCSEFEKLLHRDLWVLAKSSALDLVGLLSLITLPRAGADRLAIAAAAVIVACCGKAERCLQRVALQITHGASRSPAPDS